MTRSKKLFSFLSFFALSLGAIGLASNKSMKSSKASEEPIFKSEVTINSFQSIYPDLSGDASFLWLVIKDADYPDIDGFSISCDNEVKNYFAADILSNIELYDANGELITGVAIEQITVNMWTYHTNVAFRINKSNLAETVKLKAGMKLPCCNHLKGNEPFSYYTLKYDYVASRLSRAKASNDFEQWDIAKAYAQSVDLYDELIRPDAAVLWPHMNEVPEGSGTPDCFGTQIHFPLETINLRPNSTNEHYFNDHGDEFPIDLMKHVLINGVSMRDLVNENKNTNQYTYLWGTMKSWYAPCYLALFDDPNMVHGLRMLFGVAESFTEMEGMEIKFTPFIGYGNTDNVGVNLSKPVTFKVIGGVLRRMINIDFDGTVVTAPVGVALDESLIPNAGDALPRDGYIYYTKDWVVVDSDPQIVVNKDYIPTNDIVCETADIAHEVTYRVTFDTDGGSEVAPQDVIHDTKANKPENPTKEGFTFDAWYLNDTPFNFDTLITEDITLTAHWNVVIGKHTVTFDTDGGSALVPVAVEDNTALSKPEDPTKDGYSFQGWYLGERLYDFANPVVEDITLTAHWKAIFTITFDSNGGSTVNPLTLLDGEKVNKPSDPLKDGAAFLGWYIGDDLYNFDSPVTSNLTLTAHWNESTQYTITFDTDGGSTVGAVKVNEGEKLAQPANPIKRGYVFDGWYLGETEYDFSTPVASDFTLKAHWTTPKTNNGKKGCGGSILASSAIVALVSTLGACLIISKKKED